MQISRDRLLHEAGQVALEARIRDSYIAELELENEQLRDRLMTARNERDLLQLEFDQRAGLDLGPRGDARVHMAAGSMST